MVVRGRVQNGVIVLQDGLSLPEGAEVSVLYPAAPNADHEGIETEAAGGQRVRLPLVLLHNGPAVVA
jgi:hypothetical protein